MGTVKAIEYNRGGKVEFGTVSVDPDTISSDSEAETTVSLSGVVSGDLVYVEPTTLETHLIPKSARVQATDVLGVTMKNTSASDIDGAAQEWNYIAVKFSEA